MNKSARTIVVAASFIMTTTALYAQKDSVFNQSMTIERDFNPILREATKIDKVPNTDAPKGKPVETVFSSWNIRNAVSNRIGIMKAGQVIAEPNPYQLGYAEFNIGNYLNTNLLAGVRMGSVTFDLDGHLTKGKLELPYPHLNAQFSDWKSKLANGNMRLGFDHVFDNDVRLRMHAGMRGTQLSTMNYAYEPMEMLWTVIVDDPTGEESGSYTFDKDLYALDEKGPIRKQKFGNIYAGAAVDGANWGLNFDFDHSGVKRACDYTNKGFTDNMISFGGHYDWFENENWKLRLALNMQNSSEKYTKCNPFNDSISFEKKNKSYFSIMPSLNISYVPESSNFRRVYLDFALGTERQKVYDLMQELPLTMLDRSFETPFKVKFQLGYEDNNQAYLRWGIFAGANIEQNAIGAYATCDQLVEGPFTYIHLTNQDDFAFKAGGYIDYEYNKYFGTKLNFEIHTHSSNFAYNDALVNMKLHFVSNPVDKLHLDLGFDGGIKREMTFRNNGEKYTIDLGNIADLNFRSDYNINDQLKAYIEFDNILCTERQLWPGIPAQKLNFHIGARYVF